MRELTNYSAPDFKIPALNGQKKRILRHALRKEYNPRKSAVVAKKT